MTNDDKALVYELRKFVPDTTMCNEAADRIEALSAENERLREVQSPSVNPDPLARLLASIAITLDADDLRAALDEAGLEIREKGE